MTAILPVSSLTSLDSIPLYIGQVSYQGRTYRIETQVKEPGTWWRIQQFTIAFFLSLATFGIGLAFSSVRAALKNRWEQALTGRLISRHLIEQPSPHPIERPNSGAALKESAQVELERLYQSYTQEYEQSCQSTTLISSLETLKSDIENDDSPQSNILSDMSLGNLLKQLDEDSKAIFIPNPQFINPYKGENSNPDTEEGFNVLKKYLSSAFAIGKEFVVFRFTNNVHTIVGAFRSDGKFKIIDSLLDNTVDLNRLTDALNQAQIKDAAGNPLTFRGKYINTHLQKGGHECIRFATLYGYQMAKRQSFKGYKEVNGALAEGRLRSFEDIFRINEVPLIKDASSVPSQNYKSFMHSWAYRTQGIKKNSWKDLTLADIRNYEDDNIRIRYIFKLTASEFISAYGVSMNRSLGMEDGSLPHSLPLPENWKQTRLSSLIPEGSEKVIIAVEPNKDPLIFRLSREQKMPNIGIT
ncbi:hypothetical protein [Candidatus Protochlamydia phocaeensis]|uniref:hypothetical protein n=1 Tax=Candidatus Protochlamydia phocaeensis TaxID=1414722 RepID=UPI0008392579|nr:hypothetical protein [Candidatus Protochlamydia phocaeensis]